MKREIESVIKRLETVNSGEPWFGRSVYSLLEEVNGRKVYINPTNQAGGPDSSEHSLIEIFYHMITWSDFTLKRIEKDKINDLAAAEKLDWRIIDPKNHNWKKGLAEFKTTHKKIIALLKKEDDDFLNQIVDYRKYNFRFLINGMIEHNIYHAGQIVYLNKLLS